jgi:uncharacterized protein
VRNRPTQRTAGYRRWRPKRPCSSRRTASCSCCGREKLAADTGIADDGAGWSGITLAHNVASRHEVDDVLDRARTAGGTITRAPRETFYGGYAGVVRDLDGHAWEIAHNPGFGLAADGSVLLGERG